MDPILGALAASALSGIFGSVAQARANRYNSPRQQLKRLRQAGLPMAYMYGGRVNVQSDVPRLSIDPTLGAAQQQNLGVKQEQIDNQLRIALEKLGIDWENLDVRKGELGVKQSQLGINQALLALKEKLTDEEIEKLGQEIRMISASAGIKEGELSWLTKKDDKTGITNQEQSFENAQAIQKADIFIKQNQGRLQKIFADVEEKLFNDNIQVDIRREELNKVIAEITKILSENKTINQLMDIRSLDAFVSKHMEGMLDSDNPASTLYAMLVSLFKTVK